jgi:hypothetical protein
MFKGRERAWSPYIAGVIIGLLLVPAMVGVDTTLDPSTGIVTLAEAVLALAVPGRAQSGDGAISLENISLWWQVALLVGIVLGARLSATATGSRRRVPSPIWATALGTASPGIRALTGFVGGFLLLLGASLAGGGLTGHGLSGLAQLAVSSIIVLAAIIIGGLVAGRLLHRP